MVGRINTDEIKLRCVYTLMLLLTRSTYVAVRDVSHWTISVNAKSHAAYVVRGLVAVVVCSRSALTDKSSHKCPSSAIVLPFTSLASLCFTQALRSRNLEARIASGRQATSTNVCHGSLGYMTITVLTQFTTDGMLASVPL
jgi:hypothetical protein